MSLLLPAYGEVRHDVFDFHCGGFGGMSIESDGRILTHSLNNLLDPNSRRLTLSRQWTPVISERTPIVKCDEPHATFAPDLLLCEPGSDKESVGVLYRSRSNRIAKYLLDFAETSLRGYDLSSKAILDGAVMQMESVDGGRLLVRSRFTTSLVDMGVDSYLDVSPSTIFDRRMKAITVNSLITGEVLGVATKKDRIHWGSLEIAPSFDSFTVANDKGDLKIVDAKWSLDHPRLIYLATTEGLLLYDLRTASTGINLNPTGDVGVRNGSVTSPGRKVGGFRGAFTAHPSDSLLDSGHLAMTYAALGCLLILGDDLSRVDYDGIEDCLLRCRLPDGSFVSHPGGSENDMRFVYCAAAVARIVGKERTVLNEKTFSFIRDSFNYDGGFGQGPKLESHGGSTFCALATLELAGHLQPSSSAGGVLSSTQLARCRRWCLSKQQLGFHGRSNKPDDSCYAFWIGASLKLLGALDQVDTECLREFVLSCQSETTGGFCKYPDTVPATSFYADGRRRTQEDVPNPDSDHQRETKEESVVDVWFTAVADPLHTYCSLAGLSLIGEPRLVALDPALNLPLAAAARAAVVRKQPKEATN